jgi:LPS sulfotransferase NodH
MRRFVIIAAPRSGSTFLVRALDSHPRVQCRGELFRLTQANIDSIVANPQKYRERALQPESSSIDASGFKLFYEHMTYEGHF